MWRYNQTAEPPAPFLDLVLRHPEKSTQSVPITAKVDTGADISAIPESVIAQLELPMTGKLIVQGYDGRLLDVSTYAAHIEIDSARFKVYEVVATHEPYALLGRDILNYFYVRLNGPELTLDVSLKPF
jgi:predicted aspartyl protease